MFEITLKLDEGTKHLLHAILQQQKENMSALANLNANLTALTLAVAAIIPDVNPTPGSGATEAQVQAAADTVATQVALLTAATTPPAVPVAPVSVTATAQASGIVALAFPAVPGATSYNILRSTTPGAEAVVGTSPTNSFTDTGLVTGTPYFYTVIATNAAGASPASVEVTVTA